MKKMRNILCMCLMFVSTMFIFGCNEPDDPPSNVQVSFETLKSVVDKSSDMGNWQGLNVKTLNNSQVVSSFKSSKIDDTVDFIHEKGNYKIYCEDGVRYYIEGARKYMDESDFDYSEYEEELLQDCLDEVEDFFNNNKNSENLLNSSKLDKEDNIEYTFEILVDKDTNKKNNCNLHL